MHRLLAIGVAAGVLSVGTAVYVTAQSDSDPTPMADGAYDCDFEPTSFACTIEEAPTTVPSNVHTVPTTIADDCSVEVSAAINEWIESVPDRSVLEFGVDACYLVEGTLQVVDRQDLTIVGQGATFRSETLGDAMPPNALEGSWHLWPRLRAHWMFLRGGGHTISDLTVDGPHPSCVYQGQPYEEQHVVAAYGVDGLVVEGITGGEVHGDSVSIGGDGTSPARNITVRNNTFDCIARQGSAVTWAEDVVIEDNSFDRIGRSAFDIEAAVDHWWVRRVVYRRNTVGEYNGVFFANRGAAHAVHDDIEVSDNESTVHQITVSAVGSSGRTNYRFLRNRGASVISSASVGGLRFDGIDGLLVAGNEQVVWSRYPEDGSIYAGVAVEARGGSSDITVRDNLFPRYYGMLTDRQTWPVTVLWADEGTVTLQCGNFTPDHGQPPGEPVDGVCP